MRGNEAADPKIDKIELPRLAFAFTCQTMSFFRSVLEAMNPAGRTLPSRCQSAKPPRSKGAGRAAKPVSVYSDRREMVEPDGIEPTTSCLQSTRSTD